MRRCIACCCTLVLAILTAVAWPAVAAADGGRGNEATSGQLEVPAGWFELVRAFHYDPSRPYDAGQHRGVDVRARGRDVRSVTAGVVRYSGTVAGRGVVTVLTRQRGKAFVVTYTGMGGDVSVGDVVRRGGVLGRARGVLHIGAHDPVERHRYLPVGLGASRRASPARDDGTLVRAVTHRLDAAVAGVTLPRPIDRAVSQPVPSLGGLLRSAVADWSTVSSAAKPLAAIGAGAGLAMDAGSTVARAHAGSDGRASSVIDAASAAAGRANDVDASASRNAPGGPGSHAHGAVGDRRSGGSVDDGAAGAAMAAASSGPARDRVAGGGPPASSGGRLPVRGHQTVSGGDVQRGSWSPGHIGWARSPEGRPLESVASGVQAGSPTRATLRGSVTLVGALAMLGAILAAAAARKRRRSGALRGELCAAHGAHGARHERLDVLLLAAEDALVVRLGDHDRLALDQDLERVALGDRQALADLDRNDDASKLVDLADDAGDLHLVTPPRCVVRAAVARPHAVDRSLERPQLIPSTMPVSHASGWDPEPRM